MQFSSVIFFVFLAVVIFLYGLFHQITYRYLILAVANGAFIYTFLSNWRDVWALVSFLLLGYSMIVFIPIQKHRWVVISCVAVLISYFALLKQYFLHDSLIKEFPYFTTLGLSYILFRVLQLIFDRAEGMLVSRPSFLRFFSFVTFFPTFVSGPIHNYQNFDEQVGIKARYVDFFSERLLIGLIKILIFAPGLQQIFFSMSYDIYPSQTVIGLFDNQLTQYFPFALRVGLSAAIYVVYLYFNFSGYTDIAISVGLLFGIKLPENFNKPFLATNVSEFWNRWHMSLSEWIKTYMFNPMLSRAFIWFPSKVTVNVVSYAVLFIVFFVIGIWHGSTLAFFYFGAYLGFCGVLHKIYQVVLIRWLGRKSVKSLNEIRIYNYFCRGLTFSYFAIGLMCFTLNSEQIIELLHKLGLIPGVLTVVFISIFVALVMGVNDAIIFTTTFIRRRMPNFMPNEFHDLVRIIFYTLLILLFGNFFGIPSAFVYQVF